jgi:hypothetical protein
MDSVGRPRRSWSRRGATLLVLAALAVYAAIPRFDEAPRPGAEETAAIARLRTIFNAERDFIEGRWIDRDGDGRGEPGTFEELAGAKPLRGGGRLFTPLLSSTYARVEDGCVRSCGYLFHLELFPAAAAASSVATEFRVDARPDPDGSNGHRLFFVDRRGVVMQKIGAGEWQPVR